MSRWPAQLFDLAQCPRTVTLNIHRHLLVLNSRYTFAHGPPRFHRAPAPSQAELERVLDTLIARIARTLVRAGVLVEDPEHPWRLLG